MGAYARTAATTLFVLMFSCATPGQRPSVNPGQDKEKRVVSYVTDQLGDDTFVHTNKTVGNRLAYMYAGLERELSFCLHGRSLGSNIWVDDLTIPTYASSQENSVRMNLSGCMARPDFLGIVHNHPSGSCYPSIVDVQEIVRNKYDLGMVVCDSNIDEDTIRLSYVYYKLGPRMTLVPRAEDDRVVSWD